MIEKQGSQNLYSSMVVQGDLNWTNEAHGQDGSGSIEMIGRMVSRSQGFCR